LFQLGFEEYSQLIPKVQEHIKLTMTKANREGNLIEFLRMISFPLIEVPNFEMKEEEKKILVIGYSIASKRDLLNVACNRGFLDEDFDFELSEPDKYDYSKLRNSKKYKYVLVGPIAHNQKGKGKSNSMISEMEESEEYPTVIRLLDKKNVLKISISSFEKALFELQNFRRD